MKKRIFTLLVCAICFLVSLSWACSCNSKKSDSSVPRFDGMNISEVSPLADSTAVENAKKSVGIVLTSDEQSPAPAESDEQTPDVPDENVSDGTDGEIIEVPADNMPSQTGTPVDIVDDITSEIDKELQVDADESNASVSYYAEVNQDVYLTISLINPKSFAILRFTLNGVVYQSYQFESGSTSTMLVLKVNSGNECGIKKFTLDEIKYVDDAAGNAIKDAIIEGNRSVSINVAYDKVPTVEVLSESMDYTKYSADFYVSDTYDLINYEDGCRLYFYDGVEKISEQKLKKGSNFVSFDNLVMGKTYKCVIVGIYDRYDEDGYSAHVMYESDIKPSAFCAFTDVSANYDEISFGYKILNSIAQVTDIFLFNSDGDVVARAQDKTFKNLYADTKYELRIYYTFSLDGEEYVFYDNFKVKTKAYPVPSVSATYHVRETAIDFDVHIDDDFNLLTLNSIKLYDQNGEFVASAQPSDKTIDGLARNKNYVLKFLYTYDLKDGRGVVEAEKVIAFSTSKAVPVVEIRPSLATENSLQFDLLVTDPNVVGRIYSIRLFEKAGNKYIDGLTNTALREFTSLTPNTEYVIEVGYIYDMDDGNGSQLVTYSEEMTTAKRVPTCAIDVKVSTDSLTLSVNENDPDNAGEIVSVYIYDGAELVKKIEEISPLMTVDGLYSDREYTVIGEYKYNVNDYNQTDVVSEIRTTATTYAKRKPQITVTGSGATYSSFNYAVRVDDSFNICTITNVKLMLDTVKIDETEDLSGTFEGLYSNSKYTVEVYFSYDLNDGAGVQTDVYRKDIKTLKRDDVVLNYANMRALDNAIKFDYEIVDKDNLMTITKIELFDAHSELVESLEDLSVRIFENLETESFYTIVTTYQYDLNDGKGMQVDKVSIKYGTSGSKIYVNSLNVINFNPPSVGEEVQVSLSLDNPHDLEVTAIYISGVRCEVLNNSSDQSYVIVKFIPETEGGYFIVEITGYEYVSGGVTLTDDLTSEYKQEILIMGELSIVDYFAISDDYYLNFSQTPMRILEIYNPTGYEIYSLTYVSDYYSNNSSNKYKETTNFTVIDENHLLIKEPGITFDQDSWSHARYWLTLCGITYGIEGTRVSAPFDYMDCPVMLYNETVHVSTPDDLLSISVTTEYSNYGTYYILDNDIDMKGVAWAGVNGKGVFDGQGHTIRNLTIVIEDEGTTTEYYGLFKTFTGVIHDLHLEDIYYSIKTASSNIAVAGISALRGIVYNSSVSGTINVRANGGYVAGITNGVYDFQYWDRRTVSTNNYVENLQITVTGGVDASLLYYGRTERRYNIGTRTSTEYNYSIGELNSMILGKSYVLNSETNAVSYPYYVGDTSGAGEIYVDKQAHNVEFTFVTNCDTVEDFAMTGAAVTHIDVVREGYTVEWYDNSEFSGAPISLPYPAQENVTLYAKWTRMTVANPGYEYMETWMWNEETQSNIRGYVVKSFGKAEETDTSFVVGGYYRGYPVVGVESSAFDFIRYTQVNGGTVERDFEDIVALCKKYSVYFTSTVYGERINTVCASNIYFEAMPLSASKGNNLYLSYYGEFTLTVSEDSVNFFKEKYKWGGVTIKSFTPQDSPFTDVVTPAPTDAKNDKITAVCADADKLKESTLYQLSELPYSYYEKDGYRWLNYNGTQFVIIGSNLYAGIDSIVEDDLFRYIIYTSGEVTIDAFLAPTTASVDLTALAYKDKITVIGDGVFRDSKIRSITLNEGLREIGAYAFYNCYNLTAIKFPSTLQSVGSYAFYNCNSLQRVEMNDGITKIEEYTFYENYRLREIVFSANLKEIGRWALEGLRNYINVILPEGVEKISENGIWNCDINIYIPASVKTIGHQGIDVHNGNVYTALEKKTSGWDNNWLCGTSTTVYWGVKAMKSDENYNYLVTNDNKVVVLKCINTKLTSVTFDFAEGEVVEISREAFSNVALNEVTLPESLKVIGAYAFGFYSDRSFIKYVLIPEGVEEIGEHAFHEYTAIFSKAKVVPAGWADDIAERAVFGCLGEERNEDFVYVTEVNGIHIVGLTKEYTKQEVNLTVGDYTTLSVASRLFFSNQSITSVIIPEGVQEIGSETFTNCYNIMSLTLPESLTKIGERVFQDCFNISGTVYLSENLKNVGYGAFANASNLNIACAAAERPEDWHEYWNTWNNDFEILNSRLYWDIAEVCVGTEDYDYLVTNSGKIVILGVNDTSITELDFSSLKGDVVEIGSYAFMYCHELRGFALPDSVTTVRCEAFNNWNLRYVYLPSSVVNVGNYAFNDSCAILTPITEKAKGWDVNVWNKAITGVTSWDIVEDEYENKYLVYKVSGDSEEHRIAIY